MECLQIKIVAMLSLISPLMATGEHQAFVQATLLLWRIAKRISLGGKCNQFFCSKIICLPRFEIFLEDKEVVGEKCQGVYFFRITGED